MSSKSGFVMIDDNTGAGRGRKVGSVVHRELSAILQNKVADPRIGQVTITEVVMSRDLKYAKVFVTSSESPERLRATLLNLNRARSFIRHELGSILNMKFTPSVSFLEDEVPERSGRVISLIEKMSASKDR